MSAPYPGGCQCGAVRYEIVQEPAGYYVCHCTDCQRQSGSAFGMSMRVKAEAMHFTKGEPKTFITHGESGRPKSCAFCADCGTRLYHAFGTAVSPWFTVKPGTLDNPRQFAPIAHIWTRSAQPWMVFDETVPRFEKQPPELTTLERLWAERGK